MEAHRKASARFDLCDSPVKNIWLRQQKKKRRRGRRPSWAKGRKRKCVSSQLPGNRRRAVVCTATQLGSHRWHSETTRSLKDSLSKKVCSMSPHPPPLTSCLPLLPPTPASLGFLNDICPLPVGRQSWNLTQKYTALSPLNGSTLQLNAFSDESPLIAERMRRAKNITHLSPLTGCTDIVQKK